MKNTENNKKLYRRYLDDLYTTEDARQLLNSLHDPDNHETLNELSSDVWEETATQQPYTDLEREHYKREARQLLKHIEHKKRTWFHRIAVVTASTAAIVCLVLSGIHYLEHLNEQQIIYLEASTSYGERKQLLLPDGTQSNTKFLLTCPVSGIISQERERKIVLEGEGYFQVHRNEEQPFIVSTRRFDVRVLGTCFDIKSYSSDEIVSVEVESGKVQVDLPEAMMRLKGKEQVLINTISGEYSKRREERPVAIWKKRRSAFQQYSDT
ncbi:MAG: FecR family protein [Bacteroides cellulosilyticus]